MRFKVLHLLLKASKSDRDAQYQAPCKPVLYSI
jgi:hypothetical protein